MPKQLHAIVDDGTMLQETVRRVRERSPELPFAPPILVCGEVHRFQVIDQLGAIGVSPQVLLLEPQGRNTAPGVAFAAHYLVAAGRGSDLLLVMPSDHLIARPERFREAVARAAEVAHAGSLVTFGVQPHEPATGYGYIQPASADGDVRPVVRFVEKPDAATAERHMAEGYLWNAGIFLFRADSYLAALQAHAPEVAQAMATAMQGCEADQGTVRPDAEAFAAVPSISIDYAVMERASNVAVVPVDMGWSDVGSWDALWKAADVDREGNLVRGEAIVVDCRDSLIRNDQGPLVAAMGLENVVIVATADCVLVAPRARAEDVRKVVDAIRDSGREQAQASHEVRRPWGSFVSLGKSDGWQVKRIAVKPGGRLSLQSHVYRAETWVVVQGEALATLDGHQHRLAVGDKIDIPAGAVHRLENPGRTPLEVIEVQRGPYLGEDDIQRLSDVYGRAG